MNLVFISPDFQEAITVSRDDEDINNYLEDFMEKKQIDNWDSLLGTYGSWKVYREVSSSRLEYSNTIWNMFWHC
jgi:hypothetical protein